MNPPFHIHSATLHHMGIGMNKNLGLRFAELVEQHFKL